MFISSSDLPPHIVQRIEDRMVEDGTKRLIERKVEVAVSKAHLRAFFLGGIFIWLPLGAAIGWMMR